VKPRGWSLETLVLPYAELLGLSPAVNRDHHGPWHFNSMHIYTIIEPMSGRQPARPKPRVGHTYSTTSGLFIGGDNMTVVPVVTATFHHL